MKIDLREKSRWSPPPRRVLASPSPKAAESGAEVILNGRSEQSVNAAIARLQNEVPGAKARPPSPTSATPTAQRSCCGP